MASRFDSRGHPHQGDSRSYDRQSYRSHDGPSFKHRPRSSAPSSSTTGNEKRPDSRRAYVEDFAESLAHEYQPNEEDTVRAAYEDPAGRRQPDTDSDPTSAGGASDNSERRFVLIPKAEGAATDQTNGREPTANKSRHNAATPTTSTTSGNTPATPTRPSGATGSRNRGSGDHDYEANTCRKFTVPRLDSDAASTHSEASTGGSLVDEADGAIGSRRRVRRESTARPPSSGAAAAAAAATAALAAASTASSKTKPPISRRKSRLDLPRIDTDGHGNDRHSASSTGSARPRSHSRVDRADHDSRDRQGDRHSHRDNEFLSPTVIKHATYGRDRPYFEYGGGSSSAHPDRQHSRARSGDPRPVPPDHRRSHDRVDRSSASADPTAKRRSSSFSESDKPTRRPSHKRPSRDETVNSRVGRTSTAYLPKDRQSPPPQERDKERERDTGRERRGFDQDRDRQKLYRRDSTKKRRDSVARPADGYSSDEWSRRSSISVPLRRQPSDRRRALPKDDDNNPGKRSMTHVEGPRPSAPGGSGTGSAASSNGRYRSGAATPMATPRQSESHLAYGTGPLPAELFEPGGSSPPKVYRDNRDSRRRPDLRRRDSSPSPPSSPDGHARAIEDRPRGPRPRSHASNVIHNPSGSVGSPLPPLPQQQAAAPTPPQQQAARSTTLPIPIPITLPTRNAGSVRERDEVRRERRASPVDITRSRPVLPPNPARASGVFSHSPNSSQPYRQPAFYINLPGSAAEEDRLGRSPNEIAERQQDRLLNIGNSSESADPSLVPILGRYADDIYYGRIKGLPECPRREYSTQYRDWHILISIEDFLICPTCYEAAFARTPYRREIMPARVVDPRLQTRCTFGFLNWYRVALLFTKAFNMPNLELLRNVYRKNEEVRGLCSGTERVPGRWFTIRDPVTGNPVTKFSTCQQCATAIGVLFPRLKGILQDNDPSRSLTTNICSLYYDRDRKRLWKYIDVLETANNMAESTKSPVDVDALINRLLDISRFDECKKDVPVPGRKWYSMRSLPEFTVCQECFHEAVLPRVSTYRSVAGDFYREPREVPGVACHLYSWRMREIFLRACQTNDKAYLEKKLQERKSIAFDITNKIQQLSGRSPSDMIETEKLLAEWRKWE